MRKKVKFEQRAGGAEGVSMGKPSEQPVQGPEAQAGLVGSRNSEEASVAGGSERGREGWEARKGTRAGWQGFLGAILGSLALILGEMGAR